MSEKTENAKQEKTENVKQEKYNTEIPKLNMAELLNKANIVRKISVKTVFGKIDARKLPNEEEPVPVIRAMGRAHGVKTGTSTYGDWVAIKGDFFAVNLQTGVGYRGTQLFLPPVASELVESVLADCESGTVDIAFDIFAFFSENSATQYEYSAKPIIESKEADPMHGLIGRVDEKLALPEK
ncbi:MAG: hypothetical protein ACFFG0_17790 [Candidatus Thorarchaeota archaeon]